MIDKIIKYIQPIALIVVIILLLFKGNGSQQSNVISRDTIYIKTHDNYHTFHTSTLQPTHTESHYHEYITTNVVDTGAVLRDYFSKRFYADTVRNDSIDIFVSEYAFKNQVFDRKLGYKWKAPERLVIEKRSVNDFFIGGQIGYVNKQLPMFSADVLFETDKWAFGGGYDLIYKAPKITLMRKIKYPKWLRRK